MERFQYYAFISYSRKDEKWAEWLHKKLESYKLPSIIRKESNGSLPKQIRPVFRDKTDIGTGSLEQNLKAELEDSRFLIVICSPSAAASEWVNKEIRHFKSLGREERIIPFIVEGTPDPKNDFQIQCYPPELSTATLGVSINELSKEASYIKVIAAILGLKFDQLWQRHKRSEKRKFLIRTSIISFVSILLLSLIIWFWDYNRVKIKYYADYTERWGVPEGVYKLSKDEVSHRYISYLFEYQKRRLRKMKIVGCNNQLKLEGHSEKAKRSPEIHFEYRDDGKLVLKKCFNLMGKETIRYSYSEDMKTVNIVTANERTPQALNSGLTSTANYNNQSTIIRFLNEYDDQGRLIKQTFASDAWNKPVSDGSGVFGIAYEYYQNNQIRAITYLDESGKRTVKANLQHLCWESKKMYSYDENGWLVKIMFYDLDDQLVKNEWNYCTEEDFHDKFGNIVEIRYLDRRDKLTLNQLDVAVEKMKYDNNGNVTENSYYDQYENLTKGKFGYARLIKEFDFSPKITTTTRYFDENDKLNINDQSFAISKTIYVYTDSSVSVTNEYYNENEKPCLLKGKNYFSETSYFDKNGNLYQIDYHDTLGNYCVSDMGYAMYWAEYSNNLLTLETYFPLKSTELVVKKLGYSKVTHKHDKWGNIIENCYFDRKNTPVNNAKGFHKECWTFDEKGNTTSVMYFDINGELTNNLDYKGAIYEAKYEYNTYGFPKITNNWYDKNHNPVTKNLPFETTPLHYACSSGQPKMVRDLIAEGASKLAYDQEWYTPAQTAAAFNKPECIEMIYPKFSYKIPVHEIYNVEDIDKLIAQLLIARKEKDIVKRYNDAMLLEKQIIPFSSGNPELVLCYYRTLALMADQLTDCQTAYFLQNKGSKLAARHSNNDKILLGMISSTAWFAMKAGHFKEAYEYLTPYENGILTELKTESLTLNYAHTLLFNNRFEEAKKIYLSNKGKQFLNANNLFWDNVLINDFQLLTWLGYGKPEMNSILKEMKLEPVELSTSKKSPPNQTPSIIGKWRCKENNIIIDWEIENTGLSYYKFSDIQSNLLQKAVGVWRSIEKENTIIFEEYYGEQSSKFAQANIRMVDSDHFVLLILGNGDNAYDYKQRKYERVSYEN